MVDVEQKTVWRQVLGVTVSVILLTGMGCGDRSGDTQGRLKTPPETLKPARYVSQQYRRFPEFTEGSLQERKRVMLPKLPLGAVRRGFGTGARSSGATARTHGVMAMAAPVTPGNLKKGGFFPVEQLIYSPTENRKNALKVYKLNVRDQIRLEVRGHAEFSGLLDLDVSGTIQVPNTEDYVPIKGLTVEEARGVIAAKIAPYIRGETLVQLHITSASGQYYYIFGEVKQQGRFPMGIAPLKLSEAIFRANSRAAGGGRRRLSEEDVVRAGLTGRSGFRLQRFANLHKVSVISPHRSRPTRKIYNVKDALFLGKTGGDPIVRPGQIIWVPSSIDGRITRFSRRVILPLQNAGALQDELNVADERIRGEFQREDTQQFRIQNIK